MMDSKVFEISGRKLRISVVETTRPERALRQHRALVDAQQLIAREQGLDDVLLFVRASTHAYARRGEACPRGALFYSGARRNSPLRRAPPRGGRSSTPGSRESMMCCRRSATEPRLGRL